MFEEINQHRKAVEEQIQKGFEIGFTAEENSISKAHKEGDIHPNGKWVGLNCLLGGMIGA